MATKQTLDELVAIYSSKSNSNLCRVYVEGNTDKHLITWFLKQHDYRKGKHFDIFEGSDIDISGEELEARNLTNNSRSRVIAVAQEMQKLQAMPKHLSCLVDKDVDWLFRKEYPSCEWLLFSDYCDLEMYLFNESVIDKFLHLVLSTSTISATQLLDNLSPVLEKLFLIRATNQTLQWGMEWLSFESCSQLKKDNTIQFNEEEFIKRYLGKNSKLSNKSCFDEKLAELRLSSNSLPDRRDKIRGHDFIEVLYWYLKDSVKVKVKGKVIQPIEDSKAIGGSLLGCVELEQLKQEKLFKQLLARMPPLSGK